MNTYDYLEELKTFISLCTDEDLIYVLHIFNQNEVDYNSRKARSSRDLEYLKADIDCLNSLNNLKDIKKLVIKNYEKYNNHEIRDFLDEKYNNHEIRDFLDDLKKFKSKIEKTNIDFTKVKNNARFLNFACYLINEEAGDRELKNFKSKYFNFLYVALTHPEFYSSPRYIERIFSNFSDIYSKYPSHFKNDQDRYFYIWAKKYMDENPAYKSREYNPTEDSEYPIAVNSIFDMLYHKNKEVHYALRKKLSNAWYQRKYRQENKGKKENYYALTLKTKECLKALCYKRNLSEEEVIETLINENYTKECCYPSGKPLYES